MEIGSVPEDFGLTYTVPLPKNSHSNFAKSVTVDDFRGISISQVISKVFGKCVLKCFLLHQIINLGLNTV